MILVKLLGFAMLIGTVMGSVLGLQIVIDRLVAAQRRKRKAARACGNIVNIKGKKRMIFRKKKAASTAGTDETAKEFRNHSDFSIDRIIENVKTSQLYGCLIVDVAGADKTEPHLYYHTNEELRLLWAGAVEACYHAFADSGMSYKDFKDIYDLTVKRAAREGMADVIKELQKILPDVQELARKQREKLRKGNRNETA